MQFLGEFSSKVDAARAYDKRARKYHRNAADLNFDDLQPVSVGSSDSDSGSSSSSSSSSSSEIESNSSDGVARHETRELGKKSKRGRSVKKERRVQKSLSCHQPFEITAPRTQQGLCGWRCCQDETGFKNPAYKFRCSDCLNNKSNPQGYCSLAHFQKAHCNNAIVDLTSEPAGKKLGGKKQKRDARDLKKRQRDVPSKSRVGVVCSKAQQITPNGRHELRTVVNSTISAPFQAKWLLQKRLTSQRNNIKEKQHSLISLK